MTGDAHVPDADGQFVNRAHTDDMTSAGGYGIAGPQVEGALLAHPGVAEFGVVGRADEVPGMIITAFVVLKPGHDADAALAQALQDFVNQTVAPCKNLRETDFRSSLPRTETGKLQRFRLKAGA